MDGTPARDHHVGTLGRKLLHALEADGAIVVELTDAATDLLASLGAVLVVQAHAASVLFGAVVGGLVNLAVKAVQGKIHNWKDGFVAFGIGTAAGAIGATTGGGAFTMAGGAAGGVWEDF